MYNVDNLTIMYYECDILLRLFALALQPQSWLVVFLN